MYKLELLVLNKYDEEVFVDFYCDFETISGYYLDPDDDGVINIVIFGTSFTVVKEPYLMSYLKFDEKKML